MARLEIQKTYKMYIGGQFPRTESGRYYPLTDKKGKLLANVCLGSRKDFRNAVTAARGAFGGWSGRAAFNRAQILYRIAEMMEGRKAQFIDELIIQGSSASKAKAEVEAPIDEMVYYAGWCDKYQQVFSTVNPVASSHFNFSVPEPMGVIAVMAPEFSALSGLVSAIAPVIAGGNTCVVLASQRLPLCAVTLAEVINSSDVPGGVVNIITGDAAELAEHFSSHMDVNALVIYRTDAAQNKLMATNAAANVKRVYFYDEQQTKADRGPYRIIDLQEIKTTWHPVEQIGSAKAGY